MKWSHFLLFNALGGIVWATLYGVGGYLLGKNIDRLVGPVGTVTIVLAAIIIIATLIFVWRNERQLEERAEKALPGPIERYGEKLSSFVTESYKILPSLAFRVLIA